MVEVLVRSSPIAHPSTRRMELSATPGAGKASTELAQSAGNTANQDSVMMALSATSLRLTVVVLDMLSGMKISVTEKTLISAAKSGELFGIPSAELTSTMLLAAFAHQIAHLARLILVFHALRNPMVVAQAILLSVNQTRR